MLSCDTIAECDVMRYGGGLCEMMWNVKCFVSYYVIMVFDIIRNL